MTTYDVVGVNLTTRKVRILERGKDSENAEAIVMMAVARRGVSEEFFAEVPAGRYQDGDEYKE